MNVIEAESDLIEKFRDNYDPEVFGLPESCTPVNDANRELIYAMCREHGEIWLGKINRYKEDERIMWPYRGPATLHPTTAKERQDERQSDYLITKVGIVYNFGCSFAIKEFDFKLLSLLYDYNNLGGWNPQLATARINLVYARLEELGAKHFTWS